jgi:hypothetical protein
MHSIHREAMVLMASRRYFRSGVRFSISLCALATLIFVVRMAFAYHGKCGGFFPGLSAPRDCSLWTYLSGDSLAVGLILLMTYWPVVAVAIILPPALGYLRDRRERLE